MNITIAILILTAVFFVRGKVRSDMIAICSLLSLVLLNVLTPAEALAGFSNPVVIMMIGLFVVGGAIFRTGLAKMISSRILNLAGTNENVLFLLIMLVTAAIGAFVSNTGTVAVMMPIIVSMATAANINPRRYLMPLAFAGSMGLFTLISTPPNLVIQDIITKNGYQPLSFFSFAPVGMVCLAVGITILFFLSKKLVKKDDPFAQKSKKGKTLAELAEEYNLHSNACFIDVLPDSPLIGNSLEQLKIPANYNIRILKILRKEKTPRLIVNMIEEVATPQSVIQKRDILFCYGKTEDIEQFVNNNNLSIKTREEVKKYTLFQTSGIAEAYIMANSKLINQTVSEIRFREEYQVNVLGVQRNREYRMDNIKTIKLSSGDALLLHGTWKDLASLSDNQDGLVLIGQPLKEAEKVTLDRKAPVAAIVMLGMILTIAFNILPAVIAILLAAVLMILLGCLRNLEEAYNTINWESVVLIGAMLPMATAFEKTGASTLISSGLVSQLGDFGPYALLGGIYFCTSLLTLFISNTATAILLAPIAIQAAITLNVSPYSFMFAVAVGASMCFASPFSTPPNALVMSAGRYTFMDYIKVGLPLQIIMGIVMVLVLPLLFPF
jgi:di/tricarboxylate transporter